MKEIHKCSECIFACKEKMVCRPNSRDCKEEYHLTKEDFCTEQKCDFFKCKCN